MLSSTLPVSVYQCIDPCIMQARKACVVRYACNQQVQHALVVMQGPVVLASGKPPTHMTMPTLSNLSSLTQLTELALSDVHNRLSLPGLQHLPCLSNLRSAFLVTCSAINMYWGLLHSMLTSQYKMDGCVCCIALRSACQYNASVA